MEVSKLRWAGHVVGMGELIKAYIILVENPEKKGNL
jgi:hypothetical protein